MANVIDRGRKNSFATVYRSSFVLISLDKLQKLDYLWFEALEPSGLALGQAQHHMSMGRSSLASEQDPQGPRGGANLGSEGSARPSRAKIAIQRRPPGLLAANGQMISESSTEGPGSSTHPGDLMWGHGDAA